MALGEWFAKVPDYFHWPISVVVGLLFGSFANVLIYRLPRDESIVWPGSRCPHCQTKIAWYDNLPVLSYLWLRGHCRHCAKGISFRYPLTELLCAALFVLAVMRWGFLPTTVLVDWPFLFILLVVTFTDIEHRMIPNELSIGGIVFGGVTSFWTIGWVDSALGIGLGYGLFYALAWVYLNLTGKSGLGGGDIKLLGAIGAFQGPVAVGITIFLSSILGSVFGILSGLLQRKGSILKQAIPYGPFLVLAILLYYFLGDDFWRPFLIPT